MIDMQLLTKLKSIIANQAGEETTGSYNLPNDLAENTVIEIAGTKRVKLENSSSFTIFSCTFTFLPSRYSRTRK